MAPLTRTASPPNLFLRAVIKLNFIIALLLTLASSQQLCARVHLSALHLLCDFDMISIVPKSSPFGGFFFFLRFLNSESQTDAETPSHILSRGNHTTTQIPTPDSAVLLLLGVGQLAHANVG